MPKSFLSAIALAAALLAAPALAATAAPAPAAAAATLSGNGWWNALGDAQLSALIAQGLEANLDLAQAQARIERSRALWAGAEAAKLPSGGVGLEGRALQASQAELPGVSRADRRAERVGALLDFSWEADLFGRLRSQSSAAAQRVRASEAQWHGMRLAVASEIAHAWFGLIGAREQLQIARTVADNRERTLALVRTRAAAGLAAPIDEVRAQADLDAALAEIPVQEAAARVATHRIAVLTATSPVGLDLPAPPANAASTLALRVPDAAAWLAQRPDLREQEAELRARQLDVAAVRAEFYPRLSITGVLGFIAGSVSGLGAASSLSWLAAPAFSAPLFDRPRIAARLAGATASQKEALAAYQQRVLLATEEVENAFARYGAGSRQLLALQRGSGHALEAERLARVRYQAGAADLLELLDAQRTAQQAQRALAQSLMEQRQQLVAVFRGLGGAAPAQP